MPNKFFPIGLQGFAGGDVAWDTDTIKVVGCSAAYVYSAAHDFLDDVGGGARLVTSAAFASKTYALGVLDAADISLVALAGGVVLTQLVVYQSTGVDATSRLLLHFDTRGDGTPISVTGNGGNVDIVWHASGLATL